MILATILILLYLAVWENWGCVGGTMFIPKSVKKLGWKKEDLKGMKISDIIELGKMGYTKEEIDAMREEPDNANLEEQLNSIKEQLSELTKSEELKNVRETVEDKPDLQAQIDEALNILGGGVSDGDNMA